MIASHKTAGASQGRRVSRRQLLQVGGLGLLNLSLPDLLCANAWATRDKKSNRPPKSCIFIMLYGGLSQIDSWDMKPDAPREIRGPYQPIATRVPGVRICEHMPRLAALSDKYSLIRSMTHNKDVHDDGVLLWMTGHSDATPQTPYFGSVMAKVRPSRQLLPSYVWLQDMPGLINNYRTGGFLGAAYSPFHVGIGTDNPSAPNFRVHAFESPADMTHQRLDERKRLLGSLDGMGKKPRDKKPSTDTYQRFQERAFDIVSGPEARRAFDLNQESPKLRDVYGRHPLGQNLLMARRLVEAGVRLVSINGWAGQPEGEKLEPAQTWDMHGTSVQPCGIFDHGSTGLGFALPRLDQALAALLEDLDQRGLLDDTLVVVGGEFGRTPKIVTTERYPGRNHWPACFTAMLAGGGIQGGMVHGVSDKNAAYVKDHPVSPDDFGATIFSALGVPPETRLDSDGFPKFASTGRALPLLRL